MSSVEEVVDEEVIEEEVVFDENYTFIEDSDGLVTFTSLEKKETVESIWASKVDSVADKNSLNSNDNDPEVNVYNPFSANNVTSEVHRNATKVANCIGPFSDNRPICECDIVKQLTARTDVRYLLSLLPDMEEMNRTQKIVFKNRVTQLLGRVLADSNLV